MSAPTPPGPKLDTAATAEFAALSTAAGTRLLEAVANVARPGPADIARWRKLAEPDLVAAAVRIVESRRDGVAKFTRSDRMWFSAKGLEQATAEPVARHKAHRFAAEGWGAIVVDLCSGIGGDSIALGKSNQVVAVDLDPAMALRAGWNANVYYVSAQVRTVTARAEDFSISPAAWLHIDPDRRVFSPKKTNAVAEYAPGLAAMLGWVETTRGGAIKLGPASDFAAHFGGPNFEVELVSLRGECKEATVWFGDRATPGVRRRATALPNGATWTDQDGAAAGSSRLVAAGPIDHWIFDPDPALIRAGLLDGFARARGWHRIEPEVDLLTGPERASSPLVTSFEVVDLFPLDLKILRREVAARGLGVLEIKTRGLAVRPEAYRAQLRPKGPNGATWILVGRRDGPGHAILARRG